MKNQAFRQSVRNLEQARSVGDAPSLGRVSRMPGTGRPKGERRRRKRSDSRRNSRQRNNRRLVILTWTAVIFIAALGGLGTALWFWLKGQMAESKRLAALHTEDQALPSGIASKFPSPTEEEAYDLVNRALAAKTPDEVNQWIRKGSASTTSILEFLRSWESRDGNVSEKIWLSSMDANQLLIDGVLVVTSRDGEIKNRLALLTPDAQGKWRMDFDAFARTVSPSWQEIGNLGNRKAVVRVMIDTDSYHNGLYRDESAWACYGMANPDHDGMLLGYCQRNSKQHLALQRIMLRENDTSGMASRAKRATLEIQQRFGAEPRQFEISKVVAEDWVTSDVAFEDVVAVEPTRTAVSKDQQPPSSAEKVR